MKALRKKLKHIATSQSTSQDDNCRLFYDGSIRTRTLTLGGGEGWLLVGAKITGAGPMFGHFFRENEERYLAVRDLRQALELRDQMLIEVTQERTVRTMRKMVRREVLKEGRRKRKRVPINVIKEDAKRDVRNEVRTSTTTFL
jgi:hypothetical protein